MPVYKIPSAIDLAAHIRQVSVDAGFDVALTQHYSVDHSIAVPLHFLTPEMHVPVVPFFISGHLPPLPSAQRCYALGPGGRPRPSHHGRRRCASSSWAAAASPSKSPAPAWRPGRTDGVPDPDWALRVIKHLEEQQIEKLIGEATEYQLLKAGNVGGELLNWIAMLGAIGNHKPNYIAPQMQNGHAYGVWRWN